jgi:hypothetical protein
VIVRDEPCDAVCNPCSTLTLRALQAIADAGLTMTANAERLISLTDADDNPYELLPIIETGYVLQIYDPSTGQYVNVVPDPHNRDHRERLSRSMVNGFVINPIKTAATAETASNQ